jgi:hypothetical protein
MVIELIIFVDLFLLKKFKLKNIAIVYAIPKEDEKQPISTGDT